MNDVMIDFRACIYTYISAHVSCTSLLISQADATKVGPVANLASHVSDPWAINVATNGKSIPF